MNKNINQNKEPKKKFPTWLVDYCWKLIDEKSHRIGSQIILDILSKNINQKVVILINSEEHSVSIINGKFCVSRI